MGQQAKQPISAAERMERAMACTKRMGERCRPTEQWLQLREEQLKRQRTEYRQRAGTQTSQ
jgi:hypothetical protein